MATKTRSAESVWNGGGKGGQGKLTTPSGTLNAVPYALGMRFKDDPGANPEELVAAAHAGCFNMALAVALDGAGHAPEELKTTANVTIEQEDGGWRVVRSALELTGKVPGMSAEEFQKAADGAKAGCPISKLLNAEITLKATLA